eukprot:g10433.t1
MTNNACVAVKESALDHANATRDGIAKSLFEALLLRIVKGLHTYRASMLDVFGAPRVAALEISTVGKLANM